MSYIKFNSKEAPYMMGRRRAAAGVKIGKQWEIHP
jgi:hypothetical protein